MMKEFLEAALEGEMVSHMASCIKDSENQNRRNGKSSKTIQSPVGSFDLETPRDREGSFDLQILKKRQTFLNASLDNKILIFCVLLYYSEFETRRNTFSTKRYPVRVWWDSFL